MPGGGKLGNNHFVTHAKIILSNITDRNIGEISEVICCSLYFVMRRYTQLLHLGFFTVDLTSTSPLFGNYLKLF